MPKLSLEETSLRIYEAMIASGYSMSCISPKQAIDRAVDFQKALDLHEKNYRKKLDAYINSKQYSTGE